MTPAVRAAGTQWLLPETNGEELMLELGASKLPPWPGHAVAGGGWISHVDLPGCFEARFYLRVVFTVFLSIFNYCFLIVSEKSPQ